MYYILYNISLQYYIFIILFAYYKLDICRTKCLGLLYYELFIYKIKKKF